MTTIHNYNWKVIFEEHGFCFKQNFTTDKLRELLDLLGLTVVGYSSYEFDSSLSYSGVFLLSTSHLAWHTYPEHDFMTLDLNTCGGAVDEKLVEEFLKQSFGCIRVHLNKSVFV